MGHGVFHVSIIEMARNMQEKHCGHEHSVTHLLQETRDIFLFEEKKQTCGLLRKMAPFLVTGITDHAITNDCRDKPATSVVISIACVLWVLDAGKGLKDGFLWWRWRWR